MRSGRTNTGDVTAAMARVYPELEGKMEKKESVEPQPYANLAHTTRDALRYLVDWRSWCTSDGLDGFEFLSNHLIV